MWDVAYVWTGSTNAVQLQIAATLMFYAVLLMIGQQVAEVVGEPLERLAVERVCRAVYHDGRAVQRGEYEDLLLFLTEHATLLGIVKRWRKRPHERQQLESLMWGEPSVETGAPRARLPDRAAGTLAQGLSVHPGGESMTRDRSKA